MMQRWVPIFGLAAVAFVAQAQAPAGAVQSKRVEAIWDAADNRMEQQIDIWFKDGQFPMIIQLLRFEANLYPHDYEVVSNLGWMEENVQEWDAAESTYKDYDAGNPADPDRGLMLAQFYMMRKEYAKLPDLLEPIIKDKNVHPNNFRILAHAYERLGKLADAKRVWVQYIALAPADGTAKVNLKRVEAKMGKQG